MSLVNIISAIGNNSSIYPLIVRDCGIENPVKIGMTYNQNLKDSKQMANNALRERTIDEYGSSIVWLGGIPVMNKVCDWMIKKSGFDPEVNVNLLKEDGKQGLKYNIDKFRKSAPEEVKSLEKVLSNKSKYQKLLAGKFVLSTAIPVLLMGYILPKSNFALTAKLKKKQEAVKPIVEKTMAAERTYQLPADSSNPSFKGVVSALANMSTVNKMAVTDGGLTIGRVGTARNKYEKLENGFKMTMMMFLNFVAPIWIAKGFDSISGKLFNTNVNLDPMLMNDKTFINSIKDGTLNIPKENYIDYLDKNPDSQISKLCEKYCGVRYLKSRVRDPRAYVDEKRIEKFLTEVEKFAKEAKATNNIDKYAQKALMVKSANILANVGISSILLAVALPKLTFVLRKKVTGSDAEPGLKG